MNFQAKDRFNSRIDWSEVVFFSYLFVLLPPDRLHQYMMTKIRRVEYLLCTHTAPVKVGFFPSQSHFKLGL